MTKLTKSGHFRRVEEEAERPQRQRFGPGGEETSKVLNMPQNLLLFQIFVRRMKGGKQKKAVKGRISWALMKS